MAAAAFIAAACSTSSDELPPLDEGPPVRRPTPYADAGDDDPRDGRRPGADGGGSASWLYQGGTRLRAVYRETADGLRAFAGFKDSADGASCSFTVAGDGELRCLPSGDGVAYASPGYFADASCTQPIATYGTRDCAQTAKLVSAGDRTTCPTRTRLHALGPRLAGTTAYTKSDAGTCQQVTFGSGTELYLVGDELAPTTWVVGRAVTAAAAAGVARVDVVADDGARGLAGFVDAALGTACAFRVADDGAPRCFPLSDAYVTTSVFSDAACQSTAAARSTSACPPPSVVLSSTITGCETRTTAFVGGARVPPYSASGGSCRAISAGVGVEYLGAGAAVPSSSFPAGTMRTPSGSGRVRSIDLVAPGGEAYPSRLHDAARGEDCSFRVAGDGALRCLPASTMSTQYFADAACTDRVASRFDQGGCATIPSTALLVDEATCPPRARVHAVGAARSLTRVHVKLDGTCYALTPSFTTFYTLGAEVPPGDFVSATTVDR